MDVIWLENVRRLSGVCGLPGPQNAGELGYPADVLKIKPPEREHKRPTKSESSKLVNIPALIGAPKIANMVIMLTGAL